MRLFTLTGLLICTLFASAARAAADNRPSADLGAEVREIFAVKCVQCHASTLPRPKGKFGYVLDLPRIASNTKLIVASDPARSELWRKIEDGDMPPDDARAGPLSDSQKLTILRWIAAGAPAPVTVAGQAAVASGGLEPDQRVADSFSEMRTTSVVQRSLRWIGKLHVLVVHFPIALIAAAAGVESWRILRKAGGISPVVRFCISFGAAGAVVAATLGWIHAPLSGYGSSSAGALRLHRWAGVAATTGAVLAAALSEIDGLRGRRSVLFRAALFAAALLVGAAGHLGGSLVYGDDFLKW